MKHVWSARALGRQVFGAQQDLLRAVLAPWTRRGAGLLQINCGDGAFLPMLWDGGFDLAACEHDAALRARAAGRAPRGAEILAAADDHLPFDDGEFDWTAIYVDAASPDRLEASLREARRTARRGMAAMFWNAFSLAGLIWRLSPGGAPVRPQSWRRIRRILRGECPGTITCRSILLGPPALWRGRSRTRTFPAPRVPLPIGAWCILRCDFRPARPLTGLPLRLRDALGAPTAAADGMAAGGITPARQETSLPRAEKDNTQGC